LSRHCNTIGVSLPPFGNSCVDLHLGVNLVPGTAGFEQSAELPFKVQVISKLSDVTG